MGRSRTQIYCRAGFPALLAFLLTTSIAYPWGPEGHRIVAIMAEERLTPAAAAAVRKLLGPETSLADISSWADEQKEVSGHESWDYVNVPVSESRYDSRYCRPEGCVVGKIHDFRKILEDPAAGNKVKAEALRYFVHLVADLHQPLHVWDTGSRGGNRITVRFYDEDSNLHQVWDSLVITHYSRYVRVWLWELNGKASQQMKAEWSKGTPEDWATESRNAAKKAYYYPDGKSVMKSGTELGDDYCRMAIPIIQLQLARAGIRLSWMLNEIFR
jgi:hypothetical protein